METKAIAHMLAVMLGALGFDAMARDAETETDRARLKLYARVALKNAPQDSKIAIKSRFALLGLI